MVRRSVGALLLVASLCACGRDGAESVDAAAEGFAALEGITGSLQSVAVTDADGAVAVVSAVSDGEPRAELTWIAGATAEPVRTPVPSDTPLDDLSAWWTGQEVMVMGVLCPSWEAGGEEPTWSEDRQDNATSACGSDRVALSGWSPSTGAWRTVDDLELRSRNGVVVTGVRGETALVLRRGEETPTWVTLDSTTGATQALPDAPDSGGSAEVQFAPCVTADGEGYAVLSWDGPAPDLIAAHGWSEELIRPMQDRPGGSEGGFLALTASGGSWVPVPLRGSVGRGDGSAARCSPEGVTGGLPGSGSVIDLTDGSGVASRLPDLDPPPSASDVVTLAAADGSGRIVAIARSEQLPPEDPDAPWAAAAWTYDAGSWTTLDAAEVGSGSSVLIAGQSLFALEARASADGVGIEIVGP